MRLGELVALGSWDFFDVLHVHTVELVTGDEIKRIALRAVREDKRLVFTAHDLVPNIDTGGAAFDHKTTVAARRAAAVMMTVLPYRRITHSGQLELARDLGLRLLDAHYGLYFGSCPEKM